MNLKNILPYLNIKSIYGDTDVEFTAVTQDSRMVSPGTIFVAIQGNSTDGNKYIESALNNGASAIISDNELNLDKNIPCCRIVAFDAREALGKIASILYNHPSDNLKLIGVTGTNGKTTTTYIIESILNAYGKKNGIIGTIYYKIGDIKQISEHTTPVAEKFQHLLFEMVKQNLEFAVIEVSSHAIAQKRIFGTCFDIAIFTNLTHDHLDYHKTMEEYCNTKVKLFSDYLKPNGIGIVNLDDPYADKFIAGHKKIITYGFSRGSNIMAFNIAPRLDGTQMSIYTPSGIIECDIKLIGLYNVYNIMAAVACAIAFEIDIEIIKKGLEDFIPPPGRFEYIEAGQPFKIVVDYAHTPDGLQKILETIKSLYSGRLITIFGATGDRDKSKRPEMGEIVSTYSDYIIITSDDPHSEDPDKIAEEIIKGIPKNKNNWIKIIDRAEAIKKALQMAKPYDFILIAGKGHETKQVFKNGSIDFSDKDVVLKNLERLEKIKICE